ncbi:MAG: vanadium-dependent haloperoxidase [Tabrizicola sp.]
MSIDRRQFLAGAAALIATPALAADRAELCRTALIDWHRLVLELVRHTATYSPPVASRAFAYVGIIAHEAHVGLVPGPVTLAGQLHGLTPLPVPTSGLDPAAVLDAALGKAMNDYFGNTGPSGQGAMQAMARKLAERIDAGLAPETAAASRAHGLAIAAHVWDWSQSDGGAVVENLGFPYDYTFGEDPSDWVPTSDIRIQQAPLLPNWGQNRTFALPAAADCTVKAHPEFSTEPGSAFFEAAREVYEVSKVLTEEHKIIARFWSDDPMLSPTPPGHWVSIILQIAERDGLSAERTAAALAVNGIAVADAFIGCWREKYIWNLIRPVTYIKRYIDPNWETLLITPPFPEYPSGHSVQSGAAEAALTALFGENFAFEDATHEEDGLPVRRFASFREAAEEAAISRLYGGIHYRFACEEGLVQGRCIGAHAARLRTFA